MTADDARTFPQVAARHADPRVYTDEQLLDGIKRALTDRNMDAAAGLIRLLAVQNPDAAQVILDGLGIARSAR